MESSFIKAMDYYATYGNLSKRRKFKKPSDEKLKPYIKNSVHANTQKSTNVWTKRFKEYVNDTHPEVDLDTLQDNVCAIDRYLQTVFKHEPINIHEFRQFREILGSDEGVGAIIDIDV
ncbi:13413_t:CDS:2 [Gigaspora rosea]|nr:13413_t:CDS:2 [Gigaspora rosea]